MKLLLKQLRDLSYERLVEEYDKEAEHLHPNVLIYLDEIHRRDQDKQVRIMLRYTCWITVMTFIMTVATIVNVFLAFRLLK